MFVDSYAKALIIIISSSHSFLRFHKGDHVLIESRNDTHSRYVYSSCSTISCCVFDSSQSSSISFSSVHCKALILLQNILQQLSDIIVMSKKCLGLYNLTMLGKRTFLYSAFYGFSKFVLVMKYFLFFLL